MTVINHNFGKEDREHARRLANLLNAFDECQEDMLANPGKYLESAGKMLAKAARLKMDLYAAAFYRAYSNPSIIEAPKPPEVRYIDADEYERWQQVKDIIRRECLP